VCVLKRPKGVRPVAHSILACGHEQNQRTRGAKDIRAGPGRAQGKPGGVPSERREKIPRVKATRVAQRGEGGYERKKKAEHCHRKTASAKK